MLSSSVIDSVVGPPAGSAYSMYISGVNTLLDFTGVGQIFTGNGSAVSEIQWFMWHPPGNNGALKCEIYSVNNNTNLPDTLLASSTNSVEVSVDIPGTDFNTASWISFLFNNFQTVNGTRYYAVVKSVSGNPWARFVQGDYDNPQTRYPRQYGYPYGTWQSTSTSKRQMLFKVLSDSSGGGDCCCGSDIVYPPGIHNISSNWEAGVSIVGSGKAATTLVLPAEAVGLLANNNYRCSLRHLTLDLSNIPANGVGLKLFQCHEMLLQDVAFINIPETVTAVLIEGKYKPEVGNRPHVMANETSKYNKLCDVSFIPKDAYFGTGISVVDSFGTRLENIILYMPTIGIQLECHDPLSKGGFTEGTCVRDVSIFKPQEYGYIHINTRAHGDMDNASFAFTRIEHMDIDLKSSNSTGVYIPGKILNELGSCTFDRGVIDQLNIWFGDEGVKNMTGVQLGCSADQLSVRNLILESFVLLSNNGGNNGCRGLVIDASFSGHQIQWLQAPLFAHAEDVGWGPNNTLKIIDPAVKLGSTSFGFLNNHVPYDGQSAIDRWYKDKDTSDYENCMVEVDGDSGYITARGIKPKDGEPNLTEVGTSLAPFSSLYVKNADVDNINLKGNMYLNATKTITPDPAQFIELTADNPILAEPEDIPNFLRSFDSGSHDYSIPKSASLKFTSKNIFSDPNLYNPAFESPLTASLFGVDLAMNKGVGVKRTPNIGIACTHNFIVRKDFLLNGMIDCYEGAIVLHAGPYRQWLNVDSNPTIFTAEEGFNEVEFKSFNGGVPSRIWVGNIRDGNGNLGTAGQVLTSDGHGIVWSNNSSGGGSFDQSLNTVDAVKFRNLTLLTKNGAAVDPSRETGNLTAWGDVICHGWLEASHIYGSGNNANIMMYNNVLPATNNQRFLGNSQYYWNSIYGGNVFADNLYSIGAYGIYIKSALNLGETLRDFTGSAGFANQVLTINGAGRPQWLAAQGGSNVNVKAGSVTTNGSGDATVVFQGTAFASEPSITLQVKDSLGRPLIAVVTSASASQFSIKTMMHKHLIGTSGGSVANPVANHTHNTQLVASGFEDRTSPATTPNSPYTNWATLGNPYVTMDHRHTYLDRYINTTNPWPSGVPTGNVPNKTKSLYFRDGNGNVVMAGGTVIQLANDDVDKEIYTANNSNTIGSTILDGTVASPFGGIVVNWVATAKTQ